ncbi:MAG: hypothetical protein ACE5DP_04400 [Fidelibacterota bacterium]
MDLTRLNIYQRLRDFDVPAAVLDEIFSRKEDLAVLENAWNELEATGLTNDAIAQEIAQLIFHELGFHPHQKLDEK